MKYSAHNERQRQREGKIWKHRQAKPGQDKNKKKANRKNPHNTVL